MNVLCRLIIAALLLTALPTFAQNPPTAAAVPKSPAETELDAKLKAWQEHRQQRIEVREIKGIGGGEDIDESRESLEQRYKTLLTKRWSNREWRDYWEKEGTFARSVAELYGQLVPRDGTGGLAAKRGNILRSLNEEKTALKNAQDKAATLKLELNQAETSLRGTVAADKEALPRLAERLTELESASNEAGEAAAKLDREKEQLQADIDALKANPAPESAEELARLEARKKELEAAHVEARSRAEQAMAAVTEARKRIDDINRSIEVIEQRLETPSLTLEGISVTLEPQIRAHLDTLRATPGKLLDLQTDVDLLSASVAGLNEQLGKTELEIDQYEHRIQTLEEWAKLADDKVRNQDVYYEAIDADIAAVKERLRDFEGPPDEHIKSSERVCEGSQAEPSIEHYYNCVEAIETELAELRRQEESHTASLELARVQRNSLEQLIKAQATDNDLVQREFAIATDELEHLMRKGHYRPTRRDEILQRAEAGLLKADDWTGIWVVYHDRASSKTRKLKDALITSKITGRTLKVNIDFFETELRNLEEKIPATEAYLEARTRARIFFSALMHSVWNFIKRAWPIPFYILFAWFLLWLSKRITRKLIEEVKEEADTQDERQRVETIGTVARGAFKLVVLVATFLIVLDALGLDIGPILGGAAIFGLAISFGSQNLVKDVVTGFFILLENQYAVGDIVEIGGKAGTVENVTLRRTVLRDMQGRVHNIANGSVGTVSNMSQGWSRVVIHIGVAYGSDLELVQQTVDTVGDDLFAEPEWEGKLTEPPRYIGLISFDDSSLKCRIMFKTTIFENWAAEREFNRRIKLAFDQAGIEIPFPQRDIHIIRGADLTEEEERAIAAS